MVYLQVPYVGITPLCQVAFGEGSKRLASCMWYKKTSSFDPSPHRLQYFPNIFSLRHSLSQIKFLWVNQI